MDHVSTSGGSTYAPSPYSFIDTDNPDASQAIAIGNEIIKRYTDNGGRVDEQKLMKILNMTIRHIHDKTGVLPSILAVPATADDNHPRNPKQWDWNSWEIKLFRDTECLGEIDCGDYYHICRILSLNIDEVEEVRQLLQHPSFTASLPPSRPSSRVMDDLTIRSTVKACKGERAEKLFDRIISLYSVSISGFRPTGMIRAAIELGYLPQEDIDSLYNHVMT